MSSPRGHHIDTKTWTTACRIQHLEASDQTMNMVGTQPHPSADRLPKVVLSQQPPINTPLAMALPPEGQDLAPPTSGQTPVSPTREPVQAPGPTSPSKVQTPEARKTTVLQCEEQRPQRQKSRQNEMAEKYVPDERTR